MAPGRIWREWRPDASQRLDTLTLGSAPQFGTIGSLSGTLAMDIVQVAESFVFMIGEPATSYPA